MAPRYRGGEPVWASGAIVVHPAYSLGTAGPMQRTVTAMAADATAATASATGHTRRAREMLPLEPNRLVALPAVSSSWFRIASRLCTSCSISCS